MCIRDRRCPVARTAGSSRRPGATATAGRRAPTALPSDGTASLASARPTSGGRATGLEGVPPGTGGRP
eukprot:9996956-Alexandrium_andersonii.AAC.1